MAKRKTVKKSRKTNDKHHWDETLVIAVLVASALSILLLLASYISVTGQAYSSIPSREGVLNVLSGAVVVEGSGKAKCTVQCKNVGQICILAHQNDLIVDCDTKIVGSYNCLCSGIEKVIGTVPESPTQKKIGQEIGENKAAVIGGEEYVVEPLLIQEDKVILQVNGYNIPIKIGQTQVLPNGANIILNSVNVEDQEVDYTIN